MTTEEGSATVQEGAEFEEFLQHLRSARGLDLTGYKRASLLRRVRRRMSDVGVTSFADYRDVLEVEAEEFAALFDTILINVTSFFRDPEAWAVLRDVLLPEVLGRRPEGPLRVWSAGCASGQEAYTIAMVLAELLGPDEFRTRVKIYATDADEAALAQARAATYSEREVGGIPAELLTKYFEHRGAQFTFRPDLRRSVIFGRADLVQDAPISHLDLLLCRNTLMYLTAETQAHIAGRLHYALRPHGVLFLGKAEMLLGHSALFRPVDLKNRLFSPVEGSREVPVRSGVQRDREDPQHDHHVLRSAALAASPVAQLVLDVDGLVVTSNQRADQSFGVSATDVGRPFQDLELSYRPLELRSAVEEAHSQRRTVWIRDVEWSRPRQDRQWFDVQVVPLLGPRGVTLGTAVSFVDVSRAHQLQDDLEVAHRQLETAYEELQSTNEELETTNEELQSTVEELETTNEELHSTNEELETMNEELQSMNDELQVSNTQLRDRTDEVDALNTYMESVFASLRVGIAVVGADLCVRIWNSWAVDLWGVRSDEVVGAHLLTLDIGLPLERIGPAVRGAVTDGASSTLLVPSVNRRGRPVTVQVTVSPLKEAADSGAVVIMEQVEPREAPERPQT